VNARPESVDPAIAAQLAAWDEVWRERARRLEWLRAKKGRFDDLREHYRTHTADFVNDWGVTVDPRNVRRGLPTTVPFTLDPKQREWCDWTFERWQKGEYGGAEKSRDVGLSWLVVAMSVGWCCLYDGMIIGLGSFKSDKVDERGNMGSLFEKARSFIDGLPEELRAGFDARTCSFTRRLLFPHTGASIIGEIGDNVGRGNRTSVYFVDEAAYFEHDQAVDAALSKTTDCRQDVSSVHGMQNTFAQRMHDGKSHKFTFHWRDNPRFTQADYDAFVEQWGPVITAQELDINYLASVEGVVIPPEWVNAAIDAHLKMKLPEPRGRRIGTLDVADEGIDRNAFLGRHDYLLVSCKSWTGRESDIYATTERALRMCDEIGADELIYDGDGLGAGVRGDARIINKGRRKRVPVRAFRGSGALWKPEAEVDRERMPGVKNKDYFYNAKSQAWWMLRLRFQTTYRCVKAGKCDDPHEIIDIPGDLEEQPTYSQNAAGLILIDKKPDGVASPNHGDVVMMSFAPSKGPLRIGDSLLDSEGPR
jgi:phage terminase large subunit